MSFNLTHVRRDLKNLLKPKLPSRWRFFPTLTSPDKLTVPAVFFEFTSLSNEMGGKPLAPGYVAANFDLSVILPLALSAKAEDNADAAIVALIEALDSSSDLFWGPTAEKTMQEKTGQLGWRIPVSILTSHNTPE